MNLSEKLIGKVYESSIISNAFLLDNVNQIVITLKNDKRILLTISQACKLIFGE